jgi:hypothetical protein
MKTNQNKSVLMGLLLCCWLVGGCEKEVIVPDLEGNLVGYLTTINEYHHFLDDQVNVKVTTKGLDGSYSANSDAKGRFEFKDLPAGTYDLKFEKAGYAEQVYTGVKHLGGKPTIIGYYNNNNRLDPAIRMYQIPTTTIQNISVENDSLLATFNVLTDEEQYSFFVFLFCSDQDGFVNNTATIECYTFYRHADGIYKAALDKSMLNFTPGQTIYCKAAVTTDYYNGCIKSEPDGTFILCATNQTIYVPLGNVSAQFSFVFPG